MSEEKLYTIHQLARAAGLPISTLRYYERVGLMSPTRRAENNYRLYTRDMVQRLYFIRTAQTTGFTLEDIRTLLALKDGDIAPCQDVQPLIVRRLEEVSQRIEAMQHIQSMLMGMLTRCHEQVQDAPCHVVEAFSAAMP